MPTTAPPLLAVSGLEVTLGGRTLLDGVSFELGAGEALALVGESGSGKTTLLRALIGLLPPGAIARGEARWSGDARATIDLVGCSFAQRRALRGRHLGWIPQEPAAALDPRRSAGAHLRELAGTRTEAEGWMEKVGLSPARAREYPHQWSGGMQQRLLVAMALAQRPQLLLADEPTSALDPLHQAQLIELLREMRRQLGVALILVTHDLAVAAALADRAGVIAEGRLVESGPLPEVFRRPRHSATAALVTQQPRLARRSTA